MATLTFNITALDQASQAFDKIGDKVDKLAAKLRALDGIRAKPTVKVDIDDGGLTVLRQRLNSLPNVTNARVRVTLQGAGGALAQLAQLLSAVNQLDGRTVVIDIDIRGLGGALAQLAALRAVLAALGSLGGGGGSGGGLTSGPIGWLVTLAKFAAGAVVALVKAGAYATALAVAGAAVTAAWGAAATAIAAVPAALFLVAGPAAAVMAGMDGIKRAAATIKPEFEAMQKAVSDTFERGLIPVFDKLTATFPRLTNGMQGTAVSLSDIAMRLAEMVTSTEGLDRIDVVFANINRTLGDLSPGIAATVDSLLILGSQGAAFDVLSTAVNTFGTAFRASVLDLIASGTLDTALRGLEGLLGAVAAAFVDLVHNGIEVFAAAAPGVTDFVNDLSDFFNRFDWQRLGTAVGDVFRGLGEILADVDQSTIDGIVAGFEELGDVFASPAFQQNFRNFIDAIPELLSALAGMAALFSAAVGAVGGFIEALNGLGTAVSAVGRLLRLEIGLKEFAGQMLLAGIQVAAGIDRIKDSISSIDQIRIEIDAAAAQRSLADLAEALVATPDKKSIIVDMLDGDTIARLEAIGVKVLELPDGTFRLDLDDAQFQAKLKAALALGLQGGELLWYLGLNTDEFQGKLDDAKRQAELNPIRPILDLDTGPYDGKLADAYARAGQALPMPQLNLDPGPALVQISTVQTAILGLNNLSTTAQHVQTHNIPVVISAINTLNQQRTTAPHVQTHNVPQVVRDILTLNSKNTTSKHVVSHNVQSVISALNSLNGHDTRSTHTVTTVHRTVGLAGGGVGSFGSKAVLPSGGAVVRAGGGSRVHRFAGGGILPGYSPGRDTIPAMLSPGESVLTPEATRLLGARAIRGLNRMTSGRRGIVVGQGALPGGRTGSARSAGGISFAGGDSGRVERKLDELIGVMRARDGVTVNVAGSPVGDPQETAQAVKLALRTS